VLGEVLRAKVSAFIHLFVQSRELQRSLVSITALNGALRDSEVHTRAVLQNVADGIVTAGETGLIESFSRSAQRPFGYKEHEVIGQPLRLVIAPNEDERASELATTEAVGRRKDGSCFPMEINTSLVNIGERMLTIGCIRDISAPLSKHFSHASPCRGGRYVRAGAHSFGFRTSERIHPPGQRQLANAQVLRIAGPSRQSRRFQASLPHRAEPSRRFKSHRHPAQRHCGGHAARKQYAPGEPNSACRSHVRRDHAHYSGRFAPP